MKQTDNNEIDLLLRSLAKRDESLSISDASNAGKQTSVAHLDADELNSFAERTLPAAARARYTAHLIDCPRCRKIVAQLTAAAGLPLPGSERAEQTGTTFWQKLSALLSPQVLRYAVPALALLAVVTVGILSFRQQRLGDSVARNQEAVSSKPISETQTDKADEASTRDPATGLSRKAAPAVNTAVTSADKPSKSAEKDEVAQGAGAGKVDSDSSVAAKDAPKPAAAAESQPVFAPEPTPAPPPARPQTDATADAKKNEEQAKQKEASAGTVSRETRDERPSQVAEEREVTVSRSRKAAAAGRGGSGIRAMEARRAEAQQTKRADEDGETRAVEGRRFRKQGKVWVDTAYDASRPAMTIVRGSEQYRVLVADEPGIRAVAEKLSGEVVLVWKGRAYRIR